MIIMAVLNVVRLLLDTVLFVVPDIPKFPSEIDSIFQKFLSMIKDTVSFANVLMPLNLAVILITFVLAIKNSRRIMRIFMWILRKIPFLGIK